MNVPIVLSPEEEYAQIVASRFEPEAFGLIFRRYYPVIFAYLYRRTLRYDLARDIAADTFLKAFDARHTYRFRGYPLSSWLYRIAGNELAAYHRNGKREENALHQWAAMADKDEDDRARLEEEVQGNTDFLRIQTALSQLPLSYQEVLSLRYFEGKTGSEIAIILNQKEGTVKSLLSRGLQKIRDLLGLPDATK